MLRKKLNLPELDKINDDENNPDHIDSKRPRFNSPGTSDSACIGEQNYSEYFRNPAENVSERMIILQEKLNNLLEKIAFIKNPISYVYNPAVYAAEPYEKYINLYCNNPKKIIFLGMNPGPFGMCQTGVPFGEINSVRDWLQIEGQVGQPETVCTQRKIEGFNCKRKEISGLRFWNFCKDLSGTPEIFFRNCIIYNYCPLALLNKDGGNITPADMESPLRNLLEEACDTILIEVIQLLKPEYIIGIGRYAEKRAITVLKSMNANIKVIFMPHPSPRVIKNQNWPEKAKQFIRDHNLAQYFQEGNVA